MSTDFTSQADFSKPKIFQYKSVSILFSMESLLGTLNILLILLGAIVVSLMLGSTMLSPEAVIQALLGEGSRASQILVVEIRLPRIIAGLVAGAALGLSGCLIQTMARNPLASPDLLGISQGATLAVVLGLLLGSSGLLGDWTLAVFGAALAALLVMLAAGRTGHQGYRVLIVGLGIATLLRAAAELLLSTINLQHASELYAWSIGSLIGRGYTASLPTALGLLFLLPCAVLLSRQLAVLRFEPDLASSLGLNVKRVQLWTLLLSIALAALGVSIGGPIAFISLTAPILARHFSAANQVPLTRSALIGALIVVCADTFGRSAGGSTEVPVGVITCLMGGPFLLWILLRRERD
ncbi:iron ABC transporter permease [Deefgea tanakiae]|uniref:Iron ABC transporter permease n=1 Tax=Deefgea tanakiae TaxID=2865840 RepID=A0ABX8Z8J7_9NEIS|nr:iron ABC transporter permease [Deefgea tanakiae]QZA78745.1 iron ABC transporter permease [Deefgea tanakiae]